MGVGLFSPYFDKNTHVEVLLLVKIRVITENVHDLQV